MMSIDKTPSDALAMNTFNNEAPLQNQIATQNHQGNNFYASVYYGLSEPSASQLIPRNIHWRVSRPVNSLFTGRVSILKRIKAALKAKSADESLSAPCHIVISGMGGQGKSEICLRVCHDLRECFWGVFWVDVSTVDQAKTAFLDIAKQLNSPCTTIEEAKNELNNLKHPWLLVLDNADDPEFDYQVYIPSSSHGCILMTTRNSGFYLYATAGHEELDVLDKVDAQTLLLKAARIPGKDFSDYEDQASAICALLGSHTLALIQAGSYVSQQKCSLSDYPRTYHRNQKRLLQYHTRQAQSRYKDVYATFEASAEILQSSMGTEGSDALELLSMLSMLENAPMPLSFFEVAWNEGRKLVDDNTDWRLKEHLFDSVLRRDSQALMVGQNVSKRTKQPKTTMSTEETKYEDFKICSWHRDQVIQLMVVEDREWDPFRLTNAIYLLQSLGLIFDNVAEGARSIHMHPLVHAWARDRLSCQKQNRFWVAAASAMSLIADDMNYWTSMQQKLLPHIIALLRRNVDSYFQGQPRAMISAMILNCGWLLEEFGMHDIVHKILMDLFKYLNLDPYQPSLYLIELYRCVAKSQLRGEEIDDNLTALLDEMKSIYEKELPVTHRHTQDLQRMMATIHRAAGSYDSSIETLKNIIETQRQSLSPDHGRLLATQHELSKTYLDADRPQEAVEILEDLVRTQEAVRSVEDDVMLVFKHELARAYTSTNRNKEAIVMLREIVQIRERIGLTSSPRLIPTKYALANALWIDGQHEAAIEMMVYVVHNRTHLSRSNPARERAEIALEQYRQWYAELSHNGGVVTASSND